MELESDGYLERLAKHAAVAGQLVIAISEARPARAFSIIRYFTQRVRDFGGRIALDDVGAGFFTVQDIADIRVDYVKLDGGLVAHAYVHELGHAKTCGWPLDIGTIKAAAADAGQS